jgi:hypothetical protein
MKPAVHCLRWHLNGLALNSEIGGIASCCRLDNRVCVSCLRRSAVEYFRARPNKAASSDAGPTRDGRTMKSHAKLAAALLFLIGAVELSNIAPALARGGAASIMNSPGYQRRLEESRRQGSGSYAQTPGLHLSKKWHHRRHHH